jgi:hypothetical protein
LETTVWCVNRSPAVSEKKQKVQPDTQKISVFINGHGFALAFPREPADAKRQRATVPLGICNWWILFKQHKGSAYE